jgi:hypothetical protein
MYNYLIHAELEADAALALATLAHLRPLVALRLVVFSVHRFRAPRQGDHGMQRIYNSYRGQSINFSVADLGCLTYKIVKPAL